MKLATVLLLYSTVLCGQVISPHLLKGVRSCEKRHWPAAAPTCHGYALAMAHEYYVDHPELFDPKPVISVTGNTGPAPSSLAANVVGSSALVSSGTNVDVPALQCGPYQHVEHWPGQCGPMPVDIDAPLTNAITVCAVPPPDRCVDDLHAVTEKEWLDLAGRVAALEKKER